MKKILTLFCLGALSIGAGIAATNAAAGKCGCADKCSCDKCGCSEKCATVCVCGDKCACTACGCAK